MDPKNIHPIHFVAVGLALLSLLLAILATFTSVWLDGLFFNQGLIASCVDYSFSSGPFFFSSNVECFTDASTFPAVLAIMLLSVVVLLGGAAISIVATLKQKAATMKAGGALLMIGGICSIVAVILFIVLVIVQGCTFVISGIDLCISFGYGYSFTLGWAGGVLGIMAGILALVGTTKIPPQGGGHQAQRRPQATRM